MKNHLKLFILALIAVFGQIVTADELILIQTVAADKKTFIIRKGHKDGIGQGQESLFSTKKLSLAARATEVNRNFSIWQVLDENFAIPFKKGQIVNYNNDVENIEIKIPEIRTQRQKSYFESKRFLYLRGGVGYTLNQNLSNAPTDTDKTRQGMQLDALLSYNWKPKWEIGLGLRYDNEVEVLNQGDLSLPSSRFLITAELIYQLEYFKGKRSNFYISGALGFGRSQTKVSDYVSSGLALVTPTIRIGRQKLYFNRYWFLMEGLIESVSTQESFTDSETQETNFTNAKFIIGLKF